MNLNQKNTKDVIGEVMATRGCNKLFLEILVDMVNYESVIDHMQQFQLRQLLANVGHELLQLGFSMDTKASDKIFGKAIFIAIPIATWLNTCH